MEWLKQKIRLWLGVANSESHIRRLEILTQDLVNIGVDVQFNGQSMILIYSKLKGGQLLHIDADFKDMQELKHRYNTRVETCSFVL